MAAGDERAGDSSDVERYEQVRAHALAGDAPGWRLGLALLQGRGTVAWLRACRGLALPAPAVQSAPLAQPAGGDEVVRVLATMALAAAGG